ncbi:MAG: preprotein translocase subunit YajC [Alcaligenaceae bacterium]|nr:preprotein translocase subunit YajC [Alcaligenaceae bacterium]
MTVSSFLLVTGGVSDTLMTILPILLMFCAFYFLLIRPQQKRQKAHQEMVNTIEIGTEIITGSGMLGVIERVDQNYIIVNVSVDDKPVLVRTQRGAIAQVLPKGTIKSI